MSGRFRVIQVACNDATTMCLTEDQQVFMIGGTNAHEPKLVEKLAGIPTTQIACGEQHYVALDQNGDLYTWGGLSQQYNKGQLGHGDTKGQADPKRVEALEKYRVSKVACGGYFTLVLTTDNELFACGANN